MDVTNQSFGVPLDQRHAESAASRQANTATRPGALPEHLQGDKQWNGTGPGGLHAPIAMDPLINPPFATGAGAGDNLGRDRGPMVILMTSLRVATHGQSDPYKSRQNGSVTATRAAQVAERIEDEGSEGSLLHELGSIGGLVDRSLKPVTRSKRLLRQGQRFGSEPEQEPLAAAEGKQLAMDLAAQLQADVGLARAQACGVAGSLFVSTGMRCGDALDRNTNGYPSDRPRVVGAWGWGSWVGRRKDAFLKFCRDSRLAAASPAANYAFLLHELTTSEAGTVAALKRARTPGEAAVVFRRMYERAGNSEDRSRMAAAQMIYDEA